MLKFEKAKEFLDKKNLIMELSLPDNQLKQLIKASLVELLQDRQETMIEIVREAMEDYTLGQAIQEGIENKPVSHKEIFKVFKKAD